MNNKKQSRSSFFLETVSANKAAMFRLSYSIVLNKEDAEDAVSESILKAYSHLDELKNPKKMKAWLFQILVNESRNCLRRKKQLTLTDDFSKFETGMPEANAAASSDLLEYVCQLEDIYKEVILLYYFEQFRIKEIAKILNLSEGTVKSRLSRARLQLKKFLEINHWKG